MFLGEVDPRSGDDWSEVHLQEHACMGGGTKKTSAETGIALYRFKLRDGDVTATGPAQRYRFKVRTADGREVAGTIVIGQPGETKGIVALRWGALRLHHGAEAEMIAEVKDREGEQVIFEVEQRVDGS
jgi:hypothetical protein